MAANTRRIVIAVMSSIRINHRVPVLVDSFAHYLYPNPTLTL